ncbi:MAG: c-type cytochrome [Deltaproteobacteria bacterium]|nr:c-type cytochrome [Deltaproteobacteria bacterium]
MKNFAKVVIFSITVMSLYALFANKYIPPINPSPPPTEEALDLGAMTMDQFVALGEKIFKGKGTCTLCHNPVGGRAPLLESVASRANDRLKDPRYKGEAKDAAGYIYESMTNPSAFVVASFGVLGTNDTQSPMPNVSKGAIGLNEAELKALIAYFQSIGGTDITVEIPKMEVASAGKPAEAVKPAATAEEFVNKYGCGACHKIAGQVGAIGPDLTKIGAKRNTDYLRRAIMEPDADVATGFPPGMMPKDFKDKMTAGEFEMIVQHMAKSK